MDRIMGLQGSFNSNVLALMLKSLKINNDSFKKNNQSGIFLFSDENSIYNDNFCDIESISDYKIGLGSNYSKNSINNSQPISYKNITLVFDGIIYNYNELNNYLNTNYINKNFNKNDDLNSFNEINNITDEYVSFFNDFKQNLKNKNIFISDNSDIIINNDSDIINNDSDNNINSDNNIKIDQGVLLAKLIYKYLQSSLNLKEAVKKVIPIIDGEYAFAIFDGKNLAIARDSIGIKPLYYNINDNSVNSFSSEKKALWQIGVKDSEINQLKPGYILYNWNLIPPNQNPWDFNYNKINKWDILSPINLERVEYYNEYNKIFDINKMNYTQIKSYLLKLLMDSTYKRVLDTNKVGLIFSGGVDSTILATLLKNISDNVFVKLYTVGVENSKDIECAQKVAKKLELPIETRIIDENIVKNSLDPVLDAIEEPNIMKIGVGMTLYLATKMASEDGVSVTLAGQGADELFGGYYRYLTTYKDKGPNATEKSMIHDIEYGYDVNFERDDKIATFNGVDLRVPYLDEKLVNFALKIPVKYKIDSDEDLIRKQILRDLAIDLGIDKEIAERPKKAAQYGSGIHKILIKKILKDINLDEKMVEIINNYSI